MPRITISVGSDVKRRLLRIRGEYIQRTLKDIGVSKICRELVLYALDRLSDDDVLNILMGGGEDGYSGDKC